MSCGASEVVPLSVLEDMRAVIFTVTHAGQNLYKYDAAWVYKSALRCIVLDSYIPVHGCKLLAFVMMQEESAQNGYLSSRVELLEAQLHSTAMQPACVDSLDERQVMCCSSCACADVLCCQLAMSACAVVAHNSKTRKTTPSKACSLALDLSVYTVLTTRSSASMA